MVLWSLLYVFVLYGGYLWSVDGFCLVNFVDGDQEIYYLFFKTDYLSACVDGHPTICCSIIAASAHLI